jgi:hypothetical protein
MIPHRATLVATPILGSLLLGALLLLAAPAASAQAPERNPHGELSEPCASCHRAEAWTPARPARGFAHAPRSFPLEGAHASATCTACHRTLDFRGTSGACASCHADVHQGELGADCGRCHTTRSFVDRGAMLRAHQLTRFPLAGAHVIVDCEGCHTHAPPGQMRFVGRSSMCEDCHREAVSAAKEPDHQAAGFTQACESCHYPVAWQRARFDHTGTDFPLTGAHRVAGCADCHGDRVYAGKTTTCVGCHQPDYDATTDPRHAAAGFPTDCAACHATTGWDGADFDHDGRFFPINSGEHRGEWSGCATCHTNPASYAQFTCLTCHEHRQSETDSEHDDESGYRYDSQACYACHPRGDS